MGFETLKKKKKKRIESIFEAKGTGILMRGGHEEDWKAVVRAFSAAFCCSDSLCYMAMNFVHGRKYELNMF